eukprot:767163-Hanusia_phi.AAC.1
MEEENGSKVVPPPPPPPPLVLVPCSVLDLEQIAELSGDLKCLQREREENVERLSQLQDQLMKTTTELLNLKQVIPFGPYKDTTSSPLLSSPLAFHLIPSHLIYLVYTGSSQLSQCDKLEQACEQLKKDLEEKSEESLRFQEELQESVKQQSKSEKSRNECKR